MPDQLPNASAAVRQLSTVRDFLRWALSEFRRARVVHGHGATSAIDEAAFLILESLKLPVDDINPWLDARLLDHERAALAAIIRARVETRTPAAYLVKRAYIHGIPFYVDERVIVPRSYIGELMFSGIFGGDEAPLIDDVSNVTSVLDLCTGSGCLAIIAAGIFPDAEVDAADLSADALEVARINVDEHDLADPCWRATCSRRWRGAPMTSSSPTRPMWPGPRCRPSRRNTAMSRSWRIWAAMTGWTSCGAYWRKHRTI